MPGERDAGLALLRVLLEDPLAGRTERRLGETLYAEVLNGGPLGRLLAGRGLDDEDILRPVEGDEPWRPRLVLGDTDPQAGLEGEPPADDSDQEG